MAMQVSASKWQGWVRLSRPLQLGIWTGSTLLIGVVGVVSWRPDWPLALAAVAVGGVTLQGYITHGLNDLFDWQSGTDQNTPGTISGGSHVLREGLLSPHEIRRLVLTAGMVYGGVLVVISAWRGVVFALLGAVAFLGGVLYSVPPFRFCYRPLLGEWLGIFPAVAGGAVAAGLAVGGRVTMPLVVLASLHGIVCNASVMEHHLVDIDSDWAARPPKRTSPAFWQRAIGRPGAEVAAGYELFAAIVALVAAYTVSPRFLWSVAVGVLGTILALGTHQGDIADEIRRDYWLKWLGVVHAMGYVALAAVGVGAW
jgi:1,4-dihydroxy-2-naphthoate octaprenyltransferase